MTTGEVSSNMTGADLQ